MSQNPDSKGTCQVCRNRVKLIASDGNLRKHGHGQGREPCSGSHKPPESEQTENADAISSASSQGVLGGKFENINFDVMPHPPNNGPPLLRIPKAARNPLSALLIRLIQAVVIDKHNVSKWSSLLSFGGLILSKPRRGGVKHSLSNTVLKRVAEFPNCSNGGHEKKQKKNKNKADPFMTLAKNVSSKI